MNRYLKDRLMKIHEDHRGSDYRSDYRNDYRGGEYRGEFKGDYKSDYRNSSDYYGSDSRGYDSRSDYHGAMQFYGHGGLYPTDSASDMESKYKMDLEHWINKLKSKDKFKVGFDQLINQAKSHGVSFSKYSEQEFYAIYLAMVSDYTFLGNELSTYIKMAKAFLEDDDMAVTPSEKVCIYMYYIVMGK